MAVAQSEWITLLNPPTYICSVHISHILPLNQSQILVIIRHGLTPWTLKEIWTYNIYNDNYTKLISEKNIKTSIKHYTASLHDNKSFLYLFGESGKIIKVNLKTKEFQVSQPKLIHDGSHSHSLFINGQFHIFGALHKRHKYHFIWNDNTQELETIHYIEQLQTALQSKIVHYLTSTNEVLIIADRCKTIDHYSLSTNKYEKTLPITTSGVMWWPQGVLTRNEQYMIVYGLVEDYIYICDIKLQKAWESDIKKEKDMKIAIISDIQKEELLCCGYIRKCWKLSKFKQIRVLPYYLTQIIDAYFAIETIHMMNTEKHLCLNIDYILNTKLS